MWRNKFCTKKVTAKAVIHRNAAKIVLAKDYDLMNVCLLTSLDYSSCQQ